MLQLTMVEEFMPLVHLSSKLDEHYDVLGNDTYTQSSYCTVPYIMVQYQQQSQERRRSLSRVMQ